MRGSFVMKTFGYAALVAAATTAAAWLLGCDMDYGEMFSEDAGSDAAGGGGATVCVGCSAPMVCDPTHGCVECAVPSDCRDSTTPFCVNHACVECEITPDCGPANRCHPSVYRCAPTCDTNADCEGAGMGVAGVCSNNLCVECESASDCATPLCQLERGRCVECVNGEDCPADRPLCRDLDGSCVECLVNPNCSGDGAQCVDNACQPG